MSQPQPTDDRCGWVTPAEIRVMILELNEVLASLPDGPLRGVLTAFKEALESDSEFRGISAESHDVQKIFRASTKDYADDQEVITLYEAAKRIGLAKRSKTNHTPLLLNICSKGLIDVRHDPFGIPVVRSADLPSIKILVERHRNRPRMWPEKPKKNPAARPK